MKRSLFTPIISFLLLSSTFSQGVLVTKTELPRMTSTKMSPQVATSSDGYILNMGGHTTSFLRSNTCAVIKNDGDTWSYFTLVDYRDNAGLVFLGNDSCLLVGGMSTSLGVGQLRTTELVFLNNRSSVNGPTMLIPRTWANGVKLKNGKILVAGTWWEDSAAAKPELIDLSNNSSTFTGRLHQARAFPTLVATNDGNALLFGGIGVYGGFFYPNVEEYNTSTNSFTLLRNTLFENDTTYYSVAGDMGDDFQHRTLPNGKMIFLAREIATQATSHHQPASKIFTVDPETKAFEVWAEPLPAIDTASGNPYYYFAPMINSRLGNTVIIPRIWYNQDGITQLGFVYKDPNSTGGFIECSGCITVNYYLWGASRTLYNPGGNKHGVIFTGGSISDNFDAVDSAFVAVFDHVTGVVERMDLPNEFTLKQNYPNPFNPNTVIRFELPTAGFAKGVVYDVLGREVATLINGETEAGEHQLNFNAAGLPSGVYIFRLESGGYTSSVKMVLNK